MIQFNCACGQTLTTSDQSAGKTVTCTRCGEWVAVPGEVMDSAPARPAPVSYRESALPARPRGPLEQYRDDGPDSWPRGYQPATSGRALTSLILGLVSFCIPIVASIPAIIFGFLGLVDARRGKAGKGMAIAGLCTGFLSLAVGLLITGGIIYFANFIAPEINARIVNDRNLKTLAVAMHYHNDGHKRLPQHAIYSKTDKKPLLSWRVKLLPYLGEDGLYKQFNLDEPWDSPNNKRLLTQMPKVFAHPLDRKGALEGITYYQVLVGDFGVTAFPKGPQGYSSIQSMSDGASNTIMIVEAAKGVPWTAPDDVQLSATGPLPELGLSSSFFQLVCGDGMVHIFAKNGLDDRTFRAAATPNGGEVIQLRK